MEIFELKNDKIISLIIKIRENIYKLNDRGIKNSNIKVSIPKYFQDFLIGNSHFNNYFLVYNGNLQIFDCDIIDGYNNQICVFFDRAISSSDFLEIILIK